jgi:hypothetical protein
MPLTQADLRGMGGVLPPVVTQVVTPQEQGAQAQQARAAQVQAASELPESEATKALLGLIGDADSKVGTYRVAIGNAMDAAADLESHLLFVRQKMLAMRMTEADQDMRLRLQSMVPSLNGILTRFDQMHRTLSEIEDGLTQIAAANADVLDWAKQTGYITNESA